MSLAVGHITYANCAPFFHHLTASGFCGRIVPGVPAHLNRLLAAGEIDVSPSSSFEYGRNWRDYLLLPDLSISSRGAVQSVLLFAPGSLQSLDDEEIALTGESATSVNLLEVLLREFAGVRQVRSSVPETPVEELIARGRPALLIGDRALRTALTSPPMRIYDLGELWHRYTSLPFVFALWILRRKVAEERPREVRTLIAQLAESRSRAFASLEDLAAEAPERTWMGEERLVSYWRCMSYDLPPDHLEGLDLFYKLLVKYGKLTEEPQIRFFE
jgi:chorismate dehydratase